MKRKDWRKGTIFEGIDYTDPTPSHGMVNIGSKKVPVIVMRKVKK